MSLYYAKSYDFEALKPEVQQYAFAKDLGSSKVTKATYKLHLDSSTTVDVFLTVPKGTALTASTTYDGKTYKAELQSDGRYMIRIPDISAQMFLRRRQSQLGLGTDHLHHRLGL